MNLDRRWLGTSLKFRLLAAGLMLFAAGAVLLGWSSRSRHATTKSAGDFRPSALADARLHATSLLASLPMIFEPNQGQANLDPTDPRALFIARGSGYGLFLGKQGATLALRTSAKRTDTLQMKLAGAAADPVIAAADPLPGRSNYLIGNDPASWHKNVPQFSRVRYENVYPGINLVFYGNQGQLEYDFQVAPGADPQQAELEFDGAQQLELQDGALLVEGRNGSVRIEAPNVYQQIAGRRQPVNAAFVLRGQNRAGFSIGSYDRSRELVIDPVLSFATYFGGTGDERSNYIAVDGAGNIYLTGSTTSPTLPGVGNAAVFQSAPGASGAQNVYIAKISATSNPAALTYVTYIGGTGPDYPVGISVDGAGNTYIAGTTESANFPTSTTPYQKTPLAGSAGPHHVFVTELLSDAVTLKYSSYLSGNGDDIATGMTIDASSDIYVTGTTSSTNPGNSNNPAIQFPAISLPIGLPFQANSAGPIQFFVTKVDTQAPTTGSIAYSTYFGGGNFVAPLIATGGSIAVDPNGNIYFTGTTNFIYTGCSGCGTTDFPIKNAYEPCLNTPTVINPINVPQCSNTNTSSSDAFVAKINPQGTPQLQWSTYLGGTANDSGTGIAFDTGAANVYITGTTNSTDVTTATTFGAFQACLDAAPTVVAGSCPSGVTASDAFVAKLSNPTTNNTTVTDVSLTYFSYLGGTGDETGTAITVDSASGAIITGSTTSTDFPVYPAGNNIQSVNAGGQDAFLARLNTTAVTGQSQIGTWATYFGGPGTDLGSSVALDTNQNVYFSGETNSTLPVTTFAWQTGNNGGYDAFAATVKSAAGLSLTGLVSLPNNQTYVSAGNQATFTYTLTNTGPDLANNIVITDDIRQTTTGVPVTFVSASITGGGTCSGGSTSTTITCSLPSLQDGSTATLTVVLTPTPTANGSGGTFNGGSVSASASNGISSQVVQIGASMSDFTIQANPSSFSVPSAGQSATYSVTLTPHPVYNGSISLSCGNAPTGTTCTFSPSSITLVGTSPSSATLTISTTARPIVTPAASLYFRHFYALWLGVPGLAFVGLGFGNDRRRRRVAGLLALCAVTLLLFLQPACSHTNTQPPVSGTPAGTYTISVTGTSGSDSKTQAVQLVVP